MEATAKQPFGVYVHWPFCTAKCPYCDFNSHVRAQFDEAEWVRGIGRELEYIAGLQGSSRPAVISVFFGGGTPSLMRGQSVNSILDTIGRLWPVLPGAEVTLESNPSSADAGRFRDYRAAGVNRLSLGVQALNDFDLRGLGRLHDVRQAKSALALAMRTFDRVSFDLIYARPDQTPAQWRAELQEALSFGTEHLSLYQLTIEPGTLFAVLATSGRLHTPDDDAGAVLFEVTQELTAAAGLFAYEISNHARLGAECRHNLLYWRYGDYAGAGPGAHGRLTLGGRRFALSSERLPERWQALVEVQGHGFVEHGEIPRQDAAREHLLMSLRLSEGLHLARYESLWATHIDKMLLEELKERRLIHRNPHRIVATEQGRLVLNSIVAALAA
ncbi:MAG: coproporphyrinogen III oxidase [Alphaproteobacteria bacterium]|nr:coproporphyrinogen III oxidase [Alphaproteobacteria bacterium]